jgi:hypothetical protein
MAAKAKRELQNSTEILATSRFIKGVFDLVCTLANNRQPSINHPAHLFLAHHYQFSNVPTGHSGLYTSHPGDEKARKRAHLKQTRAHERGTEYSRVPVSGPPSPCSWARTYSTMGRNAANQPTTVYYKMTGSRSIPFRRVCCTTTPPTTA